ncbi:hypothetical protein FB451DRAFT_1402915 [Mycena latifolia]|nr:hypothetical protein FB451DRAFT_1402915 [Mycena latifolia]
MQELIANGRVISCSTWLVDHETGKTLLLYLGNRYRGEHEQYENNEGLGDKTLPFLKAKPVDQASACKYLVKAVKLVRDKGHSIVQDGFEEGVIKAYNKALHGYNSTATTGVATFFKATETLELYVESVIKIAFPHEYEGMKKVWSAGKFWERNSGCHNTRAIICGLTVLPHWDDKDYGVSVSFAAGRFERGYLYLPQFQLVFEYGSGALAAFYASWIIHAVGDWDSVQMEPNDETTPGQIGTVFYIPYSSIEVLGDKEADWGLMTNYDRFPAM